MSKTSFKQPEQVFFSTLIFSFCDNYGKNMPQEAPKGCDPDFGNHLRN